MDPPIDEAFTSENWIVSRWPRPILMSNELTLLIRYVGPNLRS